MNRPTKKARYRPFRVAIVAFITTFVVVGSIGFVFWRYILPNVHLLPFVQNQQITDFHEHYGYDPNTPQVILDATRLVFDHTPIIHKHDDGTDVYLPLSFIQARDPFVFWDESAQRLFISTLYDMFEFIPNETTVLHNDVPVHFLPQAPIIRSDNQLFIHAAFMSMLYPYVVKYSPDHNIVIITSVLNLMHTAKVSVPRSALRFSQSARAAIAAHLYKDEMITVFPDAHDTQSAPINPELIRVRSSSGLLGYMPVNELEGITTFYPVDTLNITPLLSYGFIDNLRHQPQIWSGGPVHLTWEGVYHPDANNVHMQNPIHPSVNVISPQWFRLNAETLSMDSVASRAYVDWAHNKGVYVWPLVFDVNNTHARAILTNRDARRTVINQLIEYATELNLDGINIDFEHLTAPEGPYKIQFLRELAIPMRQMGLTLSAAVKVPIPETMFYRRDLIGLTVDFVMVMTYDEHWSTSPISGPVASLNFVNQGVVSMLREVPREKLIMGIPFYNRIWRYVVVDDTARTSRAVGLDHGRNFFEERGVNWVWDAEIGSYFGEVAVTEDNQAIIYRVWLEDARSIEQKMLIYTTHELAGIASWQRVLGSESVWNVLAQHFAPR